MPKTLQSFQVAFSRNQERAHQQDERGLFALKNKQWHCKGLRKKALASLALTSILASSHVFAAPAANALPTNGQVAAGQASISQSGNVMNINQSTQRAVINWDSFNVGKNATVNFNQPNSGASTLNRVNGASQSMINGAVNANGQVIFVNPNGVVFGKGAEINTGGLVATTMNIKDSDYMSGKMQFSGGESGKVINKGTITANGINGYIALMAPEVKNQGVLIANISNSNTIALVSGSKVTLSFNGSQLTDISVDASAINSLITNKHAIIANGGQIIIAANAASNLKASVINNTGTINADSISASGGKVFLTAGTVNQNGTVSANSQDANGGNVTISGNLVNLNTASKTTATGATAGGQILIGKTNANTAQSRVNASVVNVNPGAIVDASATQNGNGGSISIWSQIATNVAGMLKATGGMISGNGGNIDTSSAGTVKYGSNLAVDTMAPHGQTGHWTTDPLSITIDSNAATVLSNALNTTNVILDATASSCGGIGSCSQSISPMITFLADVYSANALTSLTLNAQGGTININSNVTAGSVYAVAQAININGSINTNGGSNSNIYLAGAIINILGNINSNGSNSNNSNNTNSGGLNSANTITANNRRNSINGQNSFVADTNTYTSNGGAINIIATGDINIGSISNATSYISANGQNGGSINIVSVNGNINNYGVMDAVGKNNLGGAITLAAQNTNTFTGALISADGYIQGGVIQLGVANGVGSGSTLAPPSINSQVATLLAAVNFTPSNTSNILSSNTSLDNTTVITANAVDSSSQVVLNSQAGQIYIAGNNSLNTVASIQANADTGGLIILSSPAGTYQNNGYIQTNGGAGLGGTIAQSALMSTTLIGATLEANGTLGGGNIVTGRDFRANPLPGSAAQDALLPNLSAVITVPTSQLTTVDANSILSANGITSGNGGNVLVWGNTNNVAGTLSAQALGKNSNGGFIETSGHTLNVVNSASISTASNNGTTGTWLLDPYDFYIASSGGNITGANLTTALSNNSVTITAANTCSGIACTATSNGTLGNIYVNDNVSWSANTLTLNSGYNIYVGTPSSMGSLTVTGSGSLTLAPSNSGVSGYTSGGQVLMGMASSSTSGLTSGYLSGSSFTTGAATGFNGQINVSTSGTIKFGSNTYTALNSESDFVGINSSSNYVIGSNLSFSTAYSAAVVSGFSGILNGFGHLISGLSINSTSSSGTNIGLFGNTSGTFSNMGLAGSVLASYDNNGVGAFAGHTSGATITNSYSTASVTGVNYVGGLVGLGQSANIYSSYSTGSILTTGSNAGGLVGYLYGGTIQSSYSTSNVSGPDTVGGLTGSVQNNSSVSNSYSIGTITGNTAGNNHQNFGGLFAYLPCGNVCTFTNNYFGGAIVTATGNSSIGGIAGGASGTNSFSGNYWNSTTNPGLNASTGGFPSSVVVSGVSSITTAQLKNASNFSSGFGNTSGSFTIASGWGYQPGVNSGFPILCAINNCTSYSSSLVSLTYAGTSGGLWETASNWDVTGSSTPSSIAPISTNASSISSLIIPSTYTVNYNTASVGPLGLSITNNGTISFSGNSNVTLSGVISGSGAIIKNGAGTVSLTAANTYGGATTINAGTLVLSGSGTLGNSSSLLTISSGTLDIQNGAVTVGSLSMSGTNPSITNSTGTSSLTISGTSTLAGSITTSGAQTYSGAVTLGANAALTATNSNITFTSAVDSTAGGYYGLSVSNGAGTTAFGGVVGGNSANSALGYLCINSSGCNASAVGTTANTGTTTLAGNVTTSGNQNYGGNLVLAGNVNLSSTSNGGNGAVTVSGSVNSSSVVGSGIIEFLGSGYWGVSTSSGSTWAYYLANSGTNTYQSSFLISGTTYTSSLSALSSPPTISYSGGNYSFSPVTSSAISYLAVGGGGAGGQNGGGGGGAGGVLTNVGSSLVTFAANTSYSIVVGAGGSSGGNGFASSISGAGITTVTALGGGYGGVGGNNGNSGGSGGGGGQCGCQLGLGGAGVSGQGYAGGNAETSSPYYSGGGGGAGAQGASATSIAAGAGGSGILNPITGSNIGQSSGGNYYIAGGGGGGSWSGVGASGGLGGGGSAPSSSGVGTSGLVNTGSGGGGSENGNNGGNGGSGVVILSSTTLIGVQNTYALTINSGTGAATIGGSVSNITTLAINSKSASSSIAGAIGGSTALKLNTGTVATVGADYTGANSSSAVLNLAGNNTYSGGTTITGGTLQAGSTTAFGGAASAITVNSGAALDLNGKTLANANALTLNGTGISSGGALTNSSATTGTYIGAITLGSDSLIGSTFGAITVTGSIASTVNAYNLALVGNQAITLRSTASTNTLSTIASSAGIGALSIDNNQALTIGSMTIGGITYSGLSSTGTIFVKTNTGNLIVNNNITTTSSSAVTSSPAILLSAGYADTTSNTTDNIVLGSSSSSFITAGTGAIIALYSGSPTSSNNLSVFATAQSTKYISYGVTTSTLPSSGAGYYALYRSTQPNLYVIYGSSSPSTYGTAPTITYSFNTLANGSGTTYLSSDTLTVNATGTAVFTGTNSTTSITGALNSSTNAGSYTTVTYLSGLSSPIYAISAGSSTGSLTISKANAYVIVTSGQSSIYGNTPTINYTFNTNSAGTGTVISASPTGLAGTASISNAPTSSSNAGTYNLTYASGLSSTNYAFNAAASATPYTVNQAQAYVILTSGQSSIYGNTPTINYTFNTNSAGTGTVISASPTGLTGTATITNAPTSSSNAGSYNLTYASGLSSTNYAFNAAASATPYTVNQAQAYVILTSGQSSIYGNTPTINYTFNTNSAGTGTVISASPTGLTGTATITNAPTSSSNAGSYNLTYASGLSSTNYAFNAAASATPYTVNQ
ncbi:filamentous hemagglutinin N-terminal domain-containing protein, partial [Polynucleobacter sp. QLW-P1DATA-2]|uniref:filamentous hemagglutinin N-terminal domain-containing protein n=1 Tax=Polynucleobacter sp. QLW-P1DATA-2 TaxID=1743167 RepID=UPI000A79E17C